MRTKTGISRFKGKWRSLSSPRTLTRWPKAPRTLATRSLLKQGPQSSLVKIENIFVNLKVTPFLCCRSFLWLSEWTQRQGDLIIISQMTVKISHSFQLYNPQEPLATRIPCSRLCSCRKKRTGYKKCRRYCHPWKSGVLNMWIDWELRVWSWKNFCAWFLRLSVFS